MEHEQPSWMMRTWPTVLLKDNQSLGVQSANTMKPLVRLTYSSKSASINIQLYPDEVRELIAALTAAIEHADPSPQRDNRA